MESEEQTGRSSSGRRPSRRNSASQDASSDPEAVQGESEGSEETPGEVVEGNEAAPSLGDTPAAPRAAGNQEAASPSSEIGEIGEIGETGAEARDYIGDVGDMGRELPAAGETGYGSGEEPEQPQFLRAEGVLDDLLKRLAQWGAQASVLGMVVYARAREEAEDILAEAQEIRRRGRP